MQINNAPQGSDEWHELRALRMTASHAQAIAANGKGLDTYVRKKMREYYSSSEPERYTSAAMTNGLEQEPVAAMLYEFNTGNMTCVVGFVTHNEYVGVSPDRLVGLDGLLEIKCPEDKVYFDYLLDRKIDTKYEWQMQMQMFVCGRSWCDYVVYNPNFRESLIIKRVFPSEDKVKKIKAGIISGIEKIKTILEMDL